MTRGRATQWALWTGIPVVLIVAVVAFWDWDWFIPLVDARASAALGRSVTIQHLHLHLGRVIRIVADDVTISNPPQWDGPPFATARQLVTDVDVWDDIFHHQLIIPLVALQQPHVNVAQAADGKTNYALQLASGGSGGDTKIGDLRINDGHVHAVLAKLKANFELDIATRETGKEPQIVVGAHGTYNAAPITGTMIGGALLSLRDNAHPWPIDLHVANGETQVALAGTLQDPLQLHGANLKLQLSGQDMSQLTPLTGIPIARTPPYRLTGQLDFLGGQVHFRDFVGKVGSSDLEGTIDVDPGKERPVVHAALRSHQVDLADLGGFIGTEPGRVSTPGQTPAKRAEVAQSEAKPNLLPDKPINLPELRFADVQLRYRGEHILGRSVPLDNLIVAMDIDNGAVNLHPLSFGVGTGSIKGNIALTPQSNRQIHAKADIEVRRADVGRMMAATHMFGGAGTISGTGEIDTTGNSLAAMLGNGNGGVRLGMAGGDLSSLLVDLSGLEFGNALLSALGIPTRTQVECLVDDMTLQRGQLGIQALVLDTGEAIVNGKGNIDLTHEGLDLQLRTEPKHFSIGSLPAPINISGTFKRPSIRPGAELAVRGAAAVGLGIAFPPLALLPMIQLGVGEDHRCDRILAEVKRQPNGQRLPAPTTQETSR
jgi:AsmA family protein